MCGRYPFTAAPEAVWRLFNSLINPIDGASPSFVLATQASFGSEMEAQS